MVKPPLILRIPRGLREQPAWMFIGSLIFITGLSYLFGVTDSAISQAIGNIGLKVWGGVLAISGGSLLCATICARPSLEKLSLRVMSLSLVAYTSYLCMVTSFRQAAMTFILAGLLIGIAEIRVWALTALIKRSETMAQQLGVDDE